MADNFIIGYRKCVEPIFRISQKNLKGSGTGAELTSRLCDVVE